MLVFLAVVLNRIMKTFILYFVLSIINSNVASADNDACRLPEKQPCTSMVPSETQSAGLGMFYQYPCKGVGCGFRKPSCRLCAIHADKIDNPYPQCPPCVKRLEDSVDSHNEEEKCLLPRRKSCTSQTPPSVTAEGLGVFYQYPCNEVGCNFFRPFCRLCAKDDTRINQPYPACPKCVV